MQLNDDPRHALLPKRHQHAPTDDGLHACGNGVGEHHVQRNSEGNIAEEGHVRLHDMGLNASQHPERCVLSVYNYFHEIAPLDWSVFLADWLYPFCSSSPLRKP